MHARHDDIDDQTATVRNGVLLRRVLATLDAAEVRWCVLHGHDSMPDHVAGDMDIVVSRRDFARMFSVLSGVPGAVVAQALVYQATSIYFVIVAFAGTELMTLALDVSCEFRAAGRCFFTADEILINRRRNRGGLWIPAPHMEFATYLLKKVLKSRLSGQVITPAAMTRLSILFAMERTEALWALRLFFSTRIAQQVADWIQTGQWTSVVANLPLLRRDVLRQALRHQPGSFVRYWVREGWRIGYRVMRPTGFVVAVLGVDGSGKSTVCEALPRRLSSLFRHCRQFHYRPFWGRASRRQMIGDAQDPPRARANVLGVIKLLYVWLDYWISWALVIAPAKARSTFVVFDRYFDDLYLDPARYRNALPPTWVRLLARCAPRPDLFVVLDTPVPQLVQRRPPLSPVTAGSLKAVYAHFANGEPSAVMVASAGDAEGVVTRVAQETIRCLARRLQRRLGMRRDGD